MIQVLKIIHTNHVCITLRYYKEKNLVNIIANKLNKSNNRTELLKIALLTYLKPKSNFKLLVLSIIILKFCINDKSK